MEQSLMKTRQLCWLNLPYQRQAEPAVLCLADAQGTSRQLRVRLAESRVDQWVSYPIDAFADGRLLLQTEQVRWLGASYLSEYPSTQKRREQARPVIHYMPPSGAMKSLRALHHTETGWKLLMDAQPTDLDGEDAPVSQLLESRDLLHWQSAPPCVLPSDASKGDRCWCGDIAQEISASDGWETCCLARSMPLHTPGLAASTLLSLPAVRKNGTVCPAPQTKNLRVWERKWANTALKERFFFELRFQLGPAVWPEIRLYPKRGTTDDIQTKACEIELKLCVGQERCVRMELCGVLWVWDALTQVLRCGAYEMPAPAVDGIVHLHFFSDLVVQEAFSGAQTAMLVLQQSGPEQAEYRIQSEQVENINNPSFCFPYPVDPAFSIETDGKTAHIVSLRIWGLRPTHFRTEHEALIRKTLQGREVYRCEAYTVYESCVDDRIYGPPAAWAVNGGRTVLSPVRTVEEFCWRDTPWGDMTRLINRTERWDAPEDSAYPQLSASAPVLNAAFRLAADIMEQNRSEHYALPGQEGLMNAALFQGPGEGFGSWVRDTCHAAFRCQNLLAPEQARESLAYIAERGFNNGEDCAAMPAIAAWDFYLATGQTRLLYEMLPGILRYAQEADSRYDEQLQLVHANMCLAQDAFEEPENGGYCLGTEILFACMYEAVAKICELTGAEPEKRVQWSRRAQAMRESIHSRFWKEEAGCFCSGPKGSKAYENSWWETTGAEMALWPRFGIASPEQTRRFLDAIKRNPDALTPYGINWYPFRKEKNHFWRACWVSWTLGIAAAASSVQDAELLETLIFQQVRNVLLNKTFHEVMDADTGRAWRWPHLPWHAAGFIGFIVNGVFGLSYDAEGLRLHPCVPPAFDGAVLRGVRYRDCELEISISGSGVNTSVFLDGKPLSGPFGLDLRGSHTITIHAE
ncbi:MAG: hypothetical protein ACLR5X_15410 [Oscillospiraceae bacterium]|nr:hypothetical protein [Clostridiales bacterium]